MTLTDKTADHRKTRQPQRQDSDCEAAARYAAVLDCNDSFDGVFYYAVRSTGVFCRPSCKSRPPSRQNVLFFDSPQDAQAAGFRPCKRCRPDLPVYKPGLDLAERAKGVIDKAFAEKEQFEKALCGLGLSRGRLSEIFRARYGMTPLEYRYALLAEQAQKLLAESRLSIPEVALASGFESLSAFYAFFKKHTRLTPNAYRLRYAVNGLR